MAINSKKRTQWKKGAAVLAALFLILSIFLWRLPGWVEKDLARQWSAQYHGKVQVKIDAGVPWNLLLGKVKNLEVTAQGITLNGLRASSLRARWGDIYFDSFSLLFDRKLKILRPGTGSINLRFSEEDLNAYLQTLRISGIVSQTLRLEPGKAILKARLNGLGLPITMTTEPFIAGPSSLGFRPLSLEVAGNRLPRALEKTVLSKAKFTIGWEGLPFPVYLNKVEPEQGNLMIFGQTSR